MRGLEYDYQKENKVNVPLWIFIITVSFMICAVIAYPVSQEYVRIDGLRPNLDGERIDIISEDQVSCSLPGGRFRIQAGEFVIKSCSLIGWCSCEKYYPLIKNNNDSGEVSSH